MIAPIYSVSVPPYMDVVAWPETRSTTVPLKLPDPPSNAVPNNTAIMKPRDPFAHLEAEEHRRRSKQKRKERRPPWRR